MSHEHDDKPRTEDPDRAAILARRQHFIALALSGLATTAACASTGADDGGQTSKGQDAATTRSEVPPEPCLKVMPPSDETETGEPAEGTTEGGSTTDAGTSSTTDGVEEAEGETGEPAPPQPCLKKAAPRPCLKKAAP